MAEKPPSTDNSTPFTKLESSEARNSATAAISSGRPIFPRGIRDSNIRFASSVRTWSCIGVAFGMKVIAWSQNLTEVKASAAGATLVDKQTLFREADVVTVHLVLSGRTRGLIGAPEFALMKPNARFVNTSRGPIVDEAALIEALQARRIAGAAVDVFDVEPLPTDHPFRKLDNVLATPHIGYVTEDLYRIFYADAAVNIATWLEANSAVS